MAQSDAVAVPARHPGRPTAQITHSLKKG
jgi:hypothetical protein